MKEFFELMTSDPDYEVDKLTDVEINDETVTLHWGSTGFCYDRELAPVFVPQIGMKTVVWGSLGRPVRGLVIGEKVIYYRTVEQEAERHRQWCEEKEQKDKRQYAADRATNDERLHRLPLEFQERIRVFREFNPEWGQRFEGYELFVCEQAVVFAGILKTPDAVSEFHKASWEDQKKQVPEILDSHSGNTFGAACSLASTFLANPELVPNVHGALCPLVGCEDYGCYAARQKAVSA